MLLASSGNCSLSSVERTAENNSIFSSSSEECDAGDCSISCCCAILLCRLEQLCCLTHRGKMCPALQACYSGVTDHINKLARQLTGLRATFIYRNVIPSLARPVSRSHL